MTDFIDPLREPYDADVSAGRVLDDDLDRYVDEAGVDDDRDKAETGHTAEDDEEAEE